jgi:hypothetical protein
MRVEELRGIFAIGAIASIAAFKTEIQTFSFFGVSAGGVLWTLAGFWTAYVLVMTTGVSQEIPHPISALFQALGHIFFAIGAIVTLGVFGYGFAIWLTFSASLDQRVQFAALFVVVAVWLLWPLQRSRKKQATPPPGAGICERHRRP